MSLLKRSKKVPRASDYDDLQASKPPKQAKTQESSFPVFPFRTTSYLSINSDPKAFYVDKTMFIPTLESLGEAVIMLAPSGFGKTLLLDTLSCYYDINRTKTHEQDFGKRWIGQVDEVEHNGTTERSPRKTPLANQFHILRLDFSTISFENFDEEVNQILNDAISEFYERYLVVTWQKTDLSLPICDNAIYSFSKLFDEYLKLQDKKLMIIIDEYDTFLNATIGHKEISHKLEKVEHKFKSFFSSIKSRLGLNLRVFIAGVAPMELSMYGGGFNVGQNNLQDDECPNLFGFTERDVDAGLELISLSPDAHKSIFAVLKELHNGYRFHRDSPDTLFNPTRIQYSLSKLAKFKRLNPNATLAELESQVRDTADPNTKPAQHVLDLVSPNQHTFNIVIDCINSPNGITSDLTEIDYQISPASLAAVDKECRSFILSWLFFQGALTYVKRNALGDTLSFVVPNNAVRAEFFSELSKYCPLAAVDSFRAALSLLLDSAVPNIDPFLRQMETSIFSTAQGHDKQDHQDDLHKALLT